MRVRVRVMCVRANRKSSSTSIRLPSPLCSVAHRRAMRWLSARWYGSTADAAPAAAVPSAVSGVSAASREDMLSSVDLASSISSPAKPATVHGGGRIVGANGGDGVDDRVNRHAVWRSAPSLSGDDIPALIELLLYFKVRLCVRVSRLSLNTH